MFYTLNGWMDAGSHHQSCPHCQGYIIYVCMCVCGHVSATLWGPCSIKAQPCWVPTLHKPVPMCTDADCGWGR